DRRVDPDLGIQQHVCIPEGVPTTDTHPQRAQRPDLLREIGIRAADVFCEEGDYLLEEALRYVGRQDLAPDRADGRVFEGFACAEQVQTVALEGFSLGDLIEGREFLDQAGDQVLFDGAVHDEVRKRLPNDFPAAGPRKDGVHWTTARRTLGVIVACSAAPRVPAAWVAPKCGETPKDSARGRPP